MEEPTEHDHSDQLVLREDRELTVAEGSDQELPEEPEPQVRGMASIWLTGATISFMLTIVAPLLLASGALGSVIVFGLLLLFIMPHDDPTRLVQSGGTILVLVGLMGSITLAAGLRYTLGLDEEQRLEQSMRSMIMKWLIVTLGSLTLWVALWEVDSTLEATLAHGVILADMVTLILAGSWFGGRLSWDSLVATIRTCRQHPFVAGAWSALSSAASFAAAAAFVILSSAGPSILEQAADGDGFSEVDWMATMQSSGARSPGGWGSGWTSPEHARFQECIERLYENKYSLRPPYEKAIRDVYHGSRFSKADAEDIVHTAILDVCTHHATKKKLQDIVPYFHRSVDNQLKTVAKSGWEQRCELSQWKQPIREPNQFNRVKLHDIKQLMCKLSQQDQEVLLLAIEGNSDREMAEELGISRGAARKRLQRARERFSKVHRRL